MARAGNSITETLGRIGERFTLLVTQHLQLMRIELEDEARDVARRATRQARAVGIAAPFVIAGVAGLSLGIALAMALLLEPWMGSWSTPFSLVAVGTLESMVAANWLVGAMRSISQTRTTSLSPTTSTAMASTTFQPTPSTPSTASPSRGTSMAAADGSDTEGDGPPPAPRPRPSPTAPRGVDGAGTVTPIDHRTSHTTGLSAATAAAPHEEKRHGAVGRT